MKQIKVVGLSVVSAMLLGSVLRADIVSPAKVQCTVEKVTPEKAVFFGFGPATFVGDITTLDLDAAQILGIGFKSGAYIGSTVTKHPLVKIKVEGEGQSNFEATFKSMSTGRNYTAVLIATENEQKKISVSLDVLERAELGRMHLNSLELDCRRL